MKHKSVFFLCRTITKSLFLLFFFTLLPTFIFSQSVAEDQAKLIAKNFFYEKVNRKKSVSYKDLDFKIRQTYTQNNQVVFRVFEPLHQSGFILVSADERTVPVLGYSFENNYEPEGRIPPNFQEWIDIYAGQIVALAKQPVRTRNPLWDYYSKVPELQNTKSIQDVAPLLSTTWNQGCSYNALCPADASGPCGHVWAGCVATAMAQVMNYHEWPDTGESSHSYTHISYGEQSADFENTTYDWANMPDGSGNAEIAKLMYHCGVSVNMNYSPSGSGAYSFSAASALKTYFKYTPNLILTSKNSYTDDHWAGLLRAEIDAGRPMYYSGRGSGGHAFVLDGYQGTDYFHVNWGWGGSYNGYFYLNDLTPGGQNYSEGQQAIVGVQSRDLYPGLDCSSPVILTDNIPYAGTTTGSTNIVNKYGLSYYQETGKEMVHQISSTWPGRITAELTNLNGNDLDVFILSHCDQDSVLAYGDSIAFADNTQPGTYLIVVDGRYAAEGSYTLRVKVPDEKPDLIITDQSVAPYKIEAGGIGHIAFKVKNIGNSASSASKTYIYYSDDQTFDGSDTLIEQMDIPVLNPNEEQDTARNITIPAGAAEGRRYIFFVADGENATTETDELNNRVSYGFEVPAAGTMDCSVSVSLTPDVWYYGNTETDGAANIENYPCSMPLPGKEVIHSITAAHNGTAVINFTEKIPGQLNVLVLASCNENNCLNSFAIWNPEDTLLREPFQVFAGVTYYFVVDAEEGRSGAYGIKVKMPGTCPEPYISTWGDTDLCTGEAANLTTDWTYTDIQWFKDGVAIEGETHSFFRAEEAGDYKVEVTENGCSAFSRSMQVRINPEPDHAEITAAGDTIFCEGNAVSLDLNTGTGYTVQWLRNGNPVEHATGLSYLAGATGVYSARVTNISCSIHSNEIQVAVNPVTADAGEPARVNANDLVSWFSCDMNDNTDLSGNGNDPVYTGWDFPEDRYGEWAKAQYYNGQWDYGSTTNSFDHPDLFTIALWIQTNTTAGGMIFGLGDAQWGASTQCDRMIYMDDAGRLYFGVLDSTAKTIATSGSYNDNSWHLVAASLSSAGMKLYVDGVLQAGDSTVTSGGNYTGWWKMAYDEIDSSFTNIPSSMYFNGVIDEIRVYERELRPQEIALLFEENPLFTLSAEQSDFCDSGATKINLINSENFIEYQLRNDADDAPVGSPVTGNADTVSLPTGMLTETTTFNILATNPATGCSRELSDLFTISVHDLPAVAMSGDAEICAGETTDITLNLTGTAPWSVNYTDGIYAYNLSTSDNPYLLPVSRAGIYQVTSISDVHCTGTDISGSAEIIVHPLPVVFLGNDTVMTTNDTLVLDAGSGFVSYLWNDNSDGQTLTVAGAGFNPGDYEFRVTVEDTNTCKNSDTINITVDQFTFTGDNAESPISLFPNPARDFITISNPNARAAAFILCNPLGVAVRTGTLNRGQQRIYIGDLRAGMYLIQIRYQGQTKSRKLIIQR